MNKQVLYKNKCSIDLMTIEDFLNLSDEKVKGRRVIAIQENDFIASGVVILTGELRVILNYNDQELESLNYILSLDDKSKADPNRYEYETYKNTIQNNKLEYNAIKPLNYGFKYVAFLDELNIVIDSEDVPFERNTLNLLTFDESIDYYSRSPVLVVQDNSNKYDIQTMQHYPQSLAFQQHFVELSEYTIYDRVQYLNYHFNIDYYLHGEKLAKFK